MEKVSYRGRDIAWNGTSKELADFIELHREKAMAFVNQGYSVEWFPDGSGYMSVYLPTTYDQDKGPEVRAVVKFIRTQHPICLNGGKIVTLDVFVSRKSPLRAMLQVPGDPTPDILFHFDRDGSDFDVSRLGGNLEARKLFEAVVKELN